MIRIVAALKVKEGKKETFIALAKELIEKSRAEAGNVDYALYQDKQDVNTLTFIEAWKDQAAIDTHNASEHFTTIFPQLGALIDDSSVKLYDAL